MGIGGKILSIVFLGAAIATILTALLQIVEFPWLRLLPGEEPAATQATRTQEALSAHSPTEETASSERQAVDLSTPTADHAEEAVRQIQTDRDSALRSADVKRPTREAASPSLPIEFTLEDGEQEVLLGGRAAVAIEFGQVGEMEFATLRIHADGSTRNQPLMGPGGRFPLTSGGGAYFLSVLRLDTTTRRAVLRIDPLLP